MPKIQLFRSRDKLGSIVALEDYDIIAAFILRTVEQHDNLTLTELLDLAAAFEENERIKLTSLFLLEVKQDLEVRGKIKVYRLSNKMQIIKISRRGRPRQVNTLLNKKMKMSGA